MGLSHGGLRQKAFNAYEETLNIPIVISNPVLFPATEGDAGARVADRRVCRPCSTWRASPRVGRRRTSNLRGRSLTPIVAAKAAPERERVERSPVDLSSVLEHEAPAETVQDEVHFTYDDHQAATALTEAPGQPNRVRALRTATHKYAFYFDPKGEKPNEYEMYDLQRDPNEVRNLVLVDSGSTRDPSDGGALEEMKERLDNAMADARTAP